MSSKRSRLSIKEVEPVRPIVITQNLRAIILILGFRVQYKKFHNIIALKPSIFNSERTVKRVDPTQYEMHMHLVPDPAHVCPQTKQQ